MKSTIRTRRACAWFLPMAALVAAGCSSGDVTSLAGLDDSTEQMGSPAGQTGNMTDHTGDPATQASSTSENLGAVAVRWELPSGHDISSLLATLKGPPGFEPRTSAISISGASALAVIFDGLPPGVYRVTLRAGECSGTSTFDVMAGAIANVRISVTCGGAPELSPPRSAECPRLIDTVLPIPGELPVGADESSVELSLTESGKNAATAWSAEGGVLRGEAVRFRRLSCSGPGAVHVSVTATAGGCQETAAATVECLPPTDDSSLGVVEVSLGTMYSCARLADGSVRCWGQNDFGQLGSGEVGPSMCLSGQASVACSTTPVAVANLQSAKGITAGGNHSCAVLADGSIECWGLNDYGQLGVGDASGPVHCAAGSSELACATTPVAVAGLTTAFAVSASEQSSTCAVLTDGSVRCWGMNGGQLGIASYEGPFRCPNGYACAPSPLAVPDLAEVVGLDTSAYFSCARQVGGAALCWGDNGLGQLGVGTTLNAWLPAPVQDVNQTIAVTTGGIHTCALFRDGAVACWGDARAGKLGTSTSSTCALPVLPPLNAACSTTPVRIPDLVDVTAIAAGANHTCALMADTTVVCWGQNDLGQLGTGDALGPATCATGLGGTIVTCATRPVAVPGLTGVTAISAGATHTCAALGDGSVRCWGGNVFGQLGDGTTIDSATPVRVTF